MPALQARYSRRPGVDLNGNSAVGRLGRIVQVTQNLTPVSRRPKDGQIAAKFVLQNNDKIIRMNEIGIQEVCCCKHVHSVTNQLKRSRFLLSDPRFSQSFPQIG